MCPNQRQFFDKFNLMKILLFVEKGYFYTSNSFSSQLIFEKNFLYIFQNIRPPLWPHPTPKDHNLSKLKSTLHEDGSSQVTDFLANKLSYKFLCKKPLIVAPPNSRGSRFKQIWIYPNWGCFLTSYRFSEQLVFEKFS